MLHVLNTLHRRRINDITQIYMAHNACYLVLVMAVGCGGRITYYFIQYNPTEWHNMFFICFGYTKYFCSVSLSLSLVFLYKNAPHLLKNNKPIDDDEDDDVDRTEDN